MRIVCFGDSVTRGITFLKGRLRIVKAVYPVLLEQALYDRRAVEVINKGVFNDNSTLLVNRLNTDVLALAPDYVLVEIGGNDCNFKWDEVAQRPEDEHVPIVPLDTYMENVRLIVQRIRESGAIPILMTLLPLDPVRYYAQLAAVHGKDIAHWIARCGGIEHWHGLYNRWLKQLVDELGVKAIDLRTAFKSAGDLADLLSDDGVHPSASGYQVIAQAVADTFHTLEWA